jgi:hypothetical protein
VYDDLKQLALEENRHCTGEEDMGDFLIRSYICICPNFVNRWRDSVRSTHWRTMRIAAEIAAEKDTDEEDTNDEDECEKWDAMEREIEEMCQKDERQYPFCKDCATVHSRMSVDDVIDHHATIARRHFDRLARERALREFWANQDRIGLRYRGQRRKPKPKEKPQKKEEEPQSRWKLRKQKKTV